MTHPHAEMTPQRWDTTNTYLHEVFGEEDAALSQLRRDAQARGMPDIAISAEVGRLLNILAASINARTVVEVGTLGGYSATWIARAMSKGSRLITIDINAEYQQFAREHFRSSGVDDRIHTRCGAALQVLPQLAAELGPDSVDLVFLDGVKNEYPAYWQHVRPLIRHGGLIVADNVLGSNEWWIDAVGHEAREGADAFNRLVAADPLFVATAVPLRQGVLIARRKAD